MNRTRLLIPALLLILTSGVSASEDYDSRLEAARQAARLELDSGALEQALDEGADIALSASRDVLESQLNRTLSESELNQVQAIFRGSLANILTPEVWIEQSAAAYWRHLTTDQLTDLVAFYRSESGQAVLKVQGPLAQDLSHAADTLLNEHQQSFAEQVDAELAGLFPDYGLAEIKSDED